MTLLLARLRFLVALRVRFVVFDGRAYFLLHFLVGVGNGALDLIRCFGGNRFLFGREVLLWWQYDGAVRVDWQRAFRQRSLRGSTETRVQSDFVGHVGLVWIEQALDGAGDVFRVDAGLDLFLAACSVIGGGVLTQDEVGDTQAGVTGLVEQCGVHFTQTAFDQSIHGTGHMAALVGGNDVD